MAACLQPILKRTGLHVLKCCDACPCGFMIEVDLGGVVVHLLRGSCAPADMEVQRVSLVKCSCVFDTAFLLFLLLFFLCVCCVVL